MQRPANRLLELLPHPYREELHSKMEAVPLQAMERLYDSGHTPHFAHFVTSGTASIVVLMKDGDGVEVSLVGSEGLVEAFHLLGSTIIATRAFVQVPGTALRIPLEVLRTEFLNCSPLRTVILQHIQARSSAVDQIAACNRIHEVEQRMARWLLMTMDRTGERSFPLTQELLAGILGTRRTTVTLAARRLQAKGCVSYSRGRIHIADRKRLELAACECYGVLRKILVPLP